MSVKTNDYFFIILLLYNYQYANQPCQKFVDLLRLHRRYYSTDFSLLKDKKKPPKKFRRLYFYHFNVMEDF